MKSTVWDISVYSLLTGILITEHLSEPSAFLRSYIEGFSEATGATLSIIATPRRTVPAFGYLVTAEVLDEIFDKRELVAVMDAAWARRQAGAAS